MSGGSDHKFHRWVNPAGRTAPGAHEIEATEAERRSLAAWLGIPAVHSLTATLTLRRESASTVAASGSFAASVDLACGVSLDVFNQALKGTIEAEFRKDPALPRPSDAGEVEINLDVDEPLPWATQGIDLGALLAEELSLALPDFPRKPGAEPATGETAPSEGERPNPFAILAKLPRPEH